MLSLKNKIVAIGFVLIILLVQSSFGQRFIDTDADTIPIKDRMYFGGNFGMQFGTITMIDLSPLVGVMITPKFSSGVGLTYQYFNDTRFAGGSSSSIGGRIFARYNVLPNIFLHTEIEKLNFDHYNFATDKFGRIWSDALFVGGGYFAPFGPRGGVNFTFLYNLLHDSLRSPYIEPYVIRVGFVM